MIYKGLVLNDKKIRIRSKKELQIRKLEFLKICNILNKLNIKYFLQTGILLGAIRDNDLIPWDWDVELSVFSQEADIKFNKLIKNLKNTGFKIESYSKKKSILKIDFAGKLSKEITSYTIKGWNYNKNKKLFWRRSYKIPQHFLLNMKKINFFKKKHYAPFPVDEFLEYQYGNWRKPIRTSNKIIYMRKEYSGINKIKYILKELINKILKFLNKR
jgi:phosphorylcholine metabolism protein LicD